MTLIRELWYMYCIFSSFGALNAQNQTRLLCVPAWVLFFNLGHRSGQPAANHQPEFLEGIKCDGI